MTNIRIKNFKCFTDAVIELNQLSLLVGANGVGKSTVIQAILLLKNTIVAFSKNEKKVALNDENITLGTADDILCQTANEQCITLSIDDKQLGNTVECRYSVDAYESPLDIHIDEVSQQGHHLLAGHHLHYLSAERLGPRISQPLHSLPYIDVGCNGQYTAQVLSHEGGMLKVEKDRMFEVTKNRVLQAQVNEWLSKILPGIHISANQDTKSLQAQIRIDNHNGLTPMLAPNIGFGISYVLPIITAGLTVEKESLFIVENPEAHLHPAAQSAIGEFLGMVAQSGVNVIIETHSDHVVNGVQLYVAGHKEFHGKVSVLNFSSSKEDVQPSIESLTMNEYGELSDWPNGFFDQTQIDFMRLQKLRNAHV